MELFALKLSVLVFTVSDDVPMLSLLVFTVPSGQKHLLLHVQILD